MSLARPRRSARRSRNGANRPPVDASNRSFPHRSACGVVQCPRFIPIALRCDPGVSGRDKRSRSWPQWPALPAGAQRTGYGFPCHASGAGAARTRLGSKLTQLRVFLQSLRPRVAAEPQVRFKIAAGQQMQVDWIVFRRGKAPLAGLRANPGLQPCQ